MDFDAAYYGFYFLEFADYYCQENNDEKEMLKLLYQSLRALESPVFSNRLVRVVFELKALAVNGEAPNVFSCFKCGGKEGLVWYSGRAARMLCADCKNSLADSADHKANPAAWRKLLESTVYTMQYIIAAEISKLYTFSVSDEVLKELEQILAEYAKYYISHTFKSLKILEEVEIVK